MSVTSHSTAHGIFGGPTAASVSGRKSTVSSVLSASSSVQVRVAVRIRPLSSRETDSTSQQCLEVHEDSCSIRPPDDDSDKSKTFNFDRVYGPEATQETLYSDVGEPLVRKVIEGVSGCVFAYGATGTGKSYAVLGEGSQPGLAPRMVTSLFRLIQENSDMEDPSPRAPSESASASTPGGATPSTTTTTLTQHEYMVSMTYLEVFNDVIKDLLNPSDRTLLVKEHPEHGIVVEHASSIVVRTADDVFRLLRDGERVRRIASTHMSDRPAKSSVILQLRVDHRTTETKAGQAFQTLRHSKLSLVDLAGSEKTEGRYGMVDMNGVNKSIATLNSVVQALADGRKQFARFTDSTLTRIMKDVLGANCVTVMVATVSPSVLGFGDTFATLQLASRAKSVKNESKKNEDPNLQIINDLHAEIDVLMEQASRTPGYTPDQPPPERVVALRTTVAELERARLNGWEERLRLSKLYETERVANTAHDAKIRNVMQTTREDNAALLVSLKELLLERNALRGQFRDKKDEHQASRDELAAAMAKYQELFADGGENGPHKEELEALLNVVDTLQKKVDADMDELRALKQEIRDLETRQIEARTEAAAQRLAKETVETEVEQVVQLEERERVEVDLQALIRDGMADERDKVLALAAAERASIMERYRKESVEGSRRELELELALLQQTVDKRLLELELQHVKRLHEQEEERRDREYRRTIRDAKLKELQLLRQVCEGFDEERRSMEQKYSEIARLLQQAVQDIVFLSNRNSELEKQLLEAGLG